jgi:uncharacterized glyoxalase superfamily protein PhnB
MSRPPVCVTAQTPAEGGFILYSAAKAIELYKMAFRAAEALRIAAPNGKFIHAEIQIGGLY